MSIIQVKLPVKNVTLVVLNCCMAGRTREFGGQREDLAWAFFSEGSEAVIACSLPVFEGMGSLFGSLLYRPWFHRTEGIGHTFAEVRAVVEAAYRDSRVWPAWTLLAYPNVNQVVSER